MVNLDRFKDSLIKNSIYLMMATFSNAILGFFFWVFAAKYYSTDDIGIMSAILSNVGLVAMLSLIGLPTALIFFLPRSDKRDKIINSSMIVVITLSIILSILFLMGMNIFLKLNIDYKFMFVFIIVSIMTTVSAIMSGSFNAGRRSSFHMIKENIFGFVKIFPLIILTGLGTMGIFMSWSIGLIMAVLIGFILLYKTYKYIPSLTFDRDVIKSMAGYSGGNHIAGIFYSLPRLVFPIMIVNMIGPSSAGYFFIAMTVAGLLYAISQSISISLLAESYDKEKLWDNVSKATRFNLALLSIGLILFMIFGRFVLELFDPIYAENAITSLIILTVASIPLSAINIFNSVRNIQRRVKSVIKINVIVSVLALALAVFLIQYGIEGVAFAYLIGNTVGAMIVIVRIKNPTDFTLRLLKINRTTISD